MAVFGWFGWLICHLSLSVPLTNYNFKPNDSSFIQSLDETIKSQTTTFLNVPAANKGASSLMWEVSSLSLEWTWRIRSFLCFLVTERPNLLPQGDKGWATWTTNARITANNITEEQKLSGLIVFWKFEVNELLETLTLQYLGNSLKNCSKTQKTLEGVHRNLCIQQAIVKIT